MKKYIVFLLFVMAVSETFSAVDDWEKYKVDHGRNFDDPAEEQLRKEIFLKNKEKIEEHNKKYEEGLVSYKMGINKFADRTEEEVRSMTGGATLQTSKDSVRSS